MTSPLNSTQLHQLTAQSQLASQVAGYRREQTRQLVTASQQCCARTRRAMTDPHCTPLSPSLHGSAQPCTPPAAARSQVAGQPGVQALVAAGAALLGLAWPGMGAR